MVKCILKSLYTCQMNGYQSVVCVWFTKEPVQKSHFSVTFLRSVFKSYISAVSKLFYWWSILYIVLLSTKCYNVIDNIAAIKIHCRLRMCDLKRMALFSESLGIEVWVGVDLSVNHTQMNRLIGSSARRFIVKWTE